MATLLSNKWLLTLTLVSAATFLIAHVLIALPIIGKNATVAGLFVISYPLFIIIATYLIFREPHLNAGTIVGGVLVFAGIAAIYMFNK